MSAKRELERRRRLIVGVTTMGCLILFDGVVRWGAPALRAYDHLAFDNEDFYRKPRQLREGSIPEIALMGSSRARFALVPQEFELVTGRSAFNLGINGAQTVEWIVVARQLFSKATPRQIVLGVNAGEFRADYRPTVAARFLFSAADLFESMVFDGASLDIVAPYLRHRLGPAWAAYEERFELRLWGQEWLGAVLPEQAGAARRRREQLAEHYPPELRRGASKGYYHPWLRGVRLNDFGKYEGASVTNIPKFAEAAIPFARFDQLLSWLGRRGAEVIVVYVPNCPLIERRWASIEPRVVATLDFICRGRGVRFIRFGQEDLPRANEDYLDEVHVGLPLARQISRRTARLIMRLVPLSHSSSRQSAGQKVSARLP